MRELKAACALVGAALVTLSCMKLQAADVTVRLINGKTGAPLGNALVILTEVSGSALPSDGAQPSEPNRSRSARARAAETGRMKAVAMPRRWMERTDAEGRVTFHITSAPPTLLVMPYLHRDGRDFVCNLCQRRGLYVLAETMTILRLGVVSPDDWCDPKGRLRGRFTPKPGEWTVFVTPLTWWQRHLPDILEP
jgi:hypothetical protein